MKNLAIMVVAQGICEDTIERFKSCVKESNPDITYDIHMISSDRSESRFNKSKLLNKGIRQLSPKYDIILQCDVDAIVCPGIIDKSFECATASDICFYNWIYEVDPTDLPELPLNYKKIDWGLIKTKRPLTAGGCWNCMKSKFWTESGGYNEYMVDWGWEDDEFRRRCSRRSKVKFLNYNKFPLIHYNHPPRTKKNMKGNREADRKAQKEGKSSWL